MHTAFSFPTVGDKGKGERVKTEAGLNSVAEFQRQATKTGHYARSGSSLGKLGTSDARSSWIPSPQKILTPQAPGKSESIDLFPHNPH